MPRLSAVRILLVAVALLAPAILSSAVAQADAAQASLVMFEEPGCPWCAQWDRDIGDSYALTDEGRQAPIRRVDMSRPRPDDLVQVKNIRFSPTFVLLRDGQEVGRITGYPGEDFFWPLLNELLAKPHNKGGQS